MISINGIHINEVIQKLSSLAFYDNTQSAKESARNSMPIYEFLEFLNIVNSEEAKYEFEDNDKNRVTLNIKAKKYKDMNFLQLEHKEVKTNKTPEGESEYYWFEYFEEDKILYFKYNKCMSDRGNYTKNGKKYYYDSYFAFEKRLIDKINNTKFNKFVIDLRDNPGGSLTFIESLVTELKNNTDLKGKDIAVISGKRTSSAGGILTWKLQNELGATVVGEETGGNVNIFGIELNKTEGIVLPNSNLNINYGSMIVDSKKGYEGGVKPDVEIIQNYEDYLNGMDSCYEYIKDISD